MHATPTPTRSTGLALAVIAALVTPLASWAQAAPDAGSLLRTQPTAPVPPALSVRPPPAPPVELPDDGPRVKVQGFLISGAVLISEPELQERLRPAIGREFSLRQLQGLAANLVTFYAERGYLARVVLPPQDVKAGMVALRIVEGRRGTLRIDSQDPGLDVARIARFVNSRLGAGQAMDIGKLGEALNILNDQPGLRVRSALVSGQVEGEVDLLVNASATPAVTAFVGINNQGPRATGEWQGNVGATLANPSGHFDSLSAIANATKGSSFGRFDYNLPLGDRGLRVGAHAARLTYHVTENALSALDANGRADEYGVSASYPLVQQNDLALKFDLKIDNKHLIDNTVVGETGNRRVQASRIGFSGQVVGAPHRWFSLGVLSFGASLVSGQVDQSNTAVLALDAATRDTQGSFNKLTYTLGYDFLFDPVWSFRATLNGQVAGRNLDSAERFSLGGPTGVRAYAVSEGTGDEGWVGSLNLDQRVRDDLIVKYFADFGSITVNRRLWEAWADGNPDQINRYKLAGWGIGMDWRVTKHLLVSGSIATPIGTNPARDSQDLNADGQASGTRGWVNVIAQF